MTDNFHQVCVQLRASLPPEVLPDKVGEFQSEPRNQFHGAGGVLLAPSLSDEIAFAVSLCNRYNVPVVPYGGGTGLVGGQVLPGVENPVIISLHRMNEIRQISTADNTITVEAGCTLERVHQEAERVNRVFPLSIASKGSCQIGGNLATNAGGIHVIRHGNMRDLCLGIEAVLPSGKVLNRLSSLRKDNFGLDIKNLLIGSEGILGIITAATLKLFPPDRSEETALLGTTDVKAAIRLLELFQGHFGQCISAYELLSKTSFEFLLKAGICTRSPLGFIPDWAILVEVGSELEFDLEDKLVEVMSKAHKQSLVTGGVVANSRRQRNDLWRLRESISEAGRHMGSIVHNDVALPIADIPEFIVKTEKELALLDSFTVNCFGHLGDGSLHYNVFCKGRPADQYSAETKSEVRSIVHGNVLACGGSIAAEHGTGRLKSSYLVEYGDPAFVESIRQIKKALDPSNVMNPGVIVDVSD